MSIFTPLGDVLGLNGDQGDYFKSKTLNNRGSNSLADLLSAGKDSNVSGAGGKLMNGASLSDAISGLSADELAGLATSPVYGDKVAQGQMLSDPTLSGLYGKGGQLDSAEQEANKLTTEGYTLQPQDIEAYGQGAGNIARQFGQTEQSLASALGDRGLAAGGGGAANASFSGVMGNKNEQLASLQNSIAQQRYHDNMQRVNQTRSYIDSLANTGQNAESAAAGRNMAGYNSRVGAANSLSAADRGDYGAQTNADMASKASQKENKILNLGDAMAGGLFSGTEALSGGGLASLLGSKQKDDKTGQKVPKGTPTTANAAGAGYGDGAGAASMGVMTA